MAKMFEVTEDDLRELNRMMYTLYKYFSLKVSSLEPKEVPKWDSAHDVDIHLRPWSYFRFAYGANSCVIHHLRDDTFTLECFGFVPKTLKPLHYKNGKMLNMFGHFDDLSTAIDNYSQVVKDYVTEKMGALF